MRNLWLLALLLTACPKAETPRVLEGCASFMGSRQQAIWEGCADGVRREILCTPGAGQKLTCSCVVDGAKGSTFGSVNPPLDARLGAMRFAAAHCSGRKWR